MKELSEVDQILMYGIHKETDSQNLVRYVEPYANHPYVGRALVTNIHTPIEILLFLLHYSEEAMVRNAAKTRLNALLQIKTEAFLAYTHRQTPWNIEWVKFFLRKKRQNERQKAYRAAKKLSSKS